MQRVCFPVLLALLSLSCGNGSGPLEVTYIGNEGFLVTMGKTKVLIDALHHSPDYASPSDRMVDQLMDGVPPFGNVNFVLVTHDHADHFNADMVNRYLHRHPAAQLIASSATVERLTGDSTGSQCTALDLARGERQTVHIDEAEVKVLRLDHGGIRDLSNLGYLVRANGYSFFHIGDARLKENEKYLRSVDWEVYKIDILFIEFFDRDSDTQSVLQDIIKPKHVIFMHIPQGEEDRVRQENAWLHPRTVVFGREGETRRFDGAAGNKESS